MRHTRAHTHDLLIKVVCPASLAFMQVREKAFEHVETLLDLLIESAGGSPPKRARLGAESAMVAGMAASMEGGA